MLGFFHGVVVLVLHFIYGKHDVANSDEFKAFYVPYLIVAFLIMPPYGALLVLFPIFRVIGKCIAKCCKRTYKKCCRGDIKGTLISETALYFILSLG